MDMDINADNESYWNRSSGAAFNFDFDGNFDECGPIGIDKSRSIEDITNDDILSEISYDDYDASTASTLELNMTVETFVTEETLKKILDNQMVVDHFIPINTTLENEVKLLRQQVQNTLYSPAPEWTVRKLKMGKMVTLQAYKSLKDKEELLDTCLNDGCAGDAIISILLHLERTLNKDLLYNILKTRPIALSHYINYLLTVSQHNCEHHQDNQYPINLIDMLKAMNKHYEAFLLQFYNILNIRNINERKLSLSNLLKEYLQENVHIPQNVFHEQIIKVSLQLCELLERLNYNDDNINMNATPMEVLYAYCMKCKDWSNQNTLKNSPFEVAQKLQISQGQFEWITLNERAQAKAYVDLDRLYENTSIWSPIKGKQFQMHISIEWVVLRLFELNVPSCVLYQFLSRITNPMEKLLLAEKVKCTKAIIDALLYMKDTNKLLKLYDNLPTRSEEYFYCEKALKNIQGKRWTFSVPSTSS